jgi:hypothetical protein
VIDNVVWADSWLSIAGADCGLTGVGAGEEQARKVVTGEASRCGEYKCGPHGGKDGKMKSWTVSWLSLKTKVELGLRGSRAMSGDWRRLHQFCGVCSGSPENHWVTRLSHKTDVKDSTRRCGLQTGSTTQEGRLYHLGRSNRPWGRYDHPDCCR